MKKKTHDAPVLSPLFKFILSTPKNRRDGLPAQDPWWRHAHLRDRADGDQREGLKLVGNERLGKNEEKLFKFFPIVCFLR